LTRNEGTISCAITMRLSATTALWHRACGAIPLTPGKYRRRESSVTPSLQVFQFTSVATSALSGARCPAKPCFGMGTSLQGLFDNNFARHSSDESCSSTGIPTGLAKVKEKLVVGVQSWRSRRLSECWSRCAVVGRRDWSTLTFAPGGISKLGKRVEGKVADLRFGIVWFLIGCAGPRCKAR
jgi:hypothetical protein